MCETDRRSGVCVRRTTCDVRMRACACWVAGCVRRGAELNLERYKFVVQVVIGEQRGEGVR